MPVRHDSLVPALKSLVPDDSLDALGRAVAFIRRLREIRANVFASYYLIRFGSGWPTFEQARQWYRRLGGAELWPRPFQMRFKGAAAVRLFDRAFESAVRRWRTPVRRGHSLARRVPDASVIDDTVMRVNSELRPFFNGTLSTVASLKALLTVSAFGLASLHAKVVAGNVHNMKLFPSLDTFRAGTLLLFDMGFVAYERLAAIVAGSLHFLCPIRLNGNVWIVRIRRAPPRVRRVTRNPGARCTIRRLCGARSARQP